MGTAEDHVMTKKNKTTSNTTSRFIDSLNLEETAQELENIKALIFDTTETNSTKIQIIKEEVLAGRYEIHNDRIADKLLEFAPQVESEENVEAEEPEIA